MRTLILFDIDGTLVGGGPAKVAFRVAMTRIFGTAGRIEGHEFSGKTDPQIARELLRGAGLADPEIDAGLSRLWEIYLGELEERLVDLPMEVLPGVSALMEALGGIDGVALGLLTGNIVGGARLKLRSAGLEGYFPVGGFGSDSEVREDLPAIAVRRATEAWGVEFETGAVVVVGDTPRDVACGKVYGHRTVAVATGRFGRRALEASGADRTLDDLRRTEEVLGTLLREPSPLEPVD